MIKLEKNITSLTKIFAIIPFIGVFLSYCFESFFFWGLGGKLGDYFEPIDFIKSSLFFIVPLLPMMLIVQFILARPMQRSIDDADNLRPSKIRASKLSFLPFDLFSILAFLAVIIYYVLYGNRVFLGIAGLILVSSLSGYFIGKYKSVLLNYGIKVLPALIACNFVTTICFAGFIAGNALTTPTTKSILSTVQIVSTKQEYSRQYALVRRLSSGIVVLEPKTRELTYLSSDIIQVIEFKRASFFQGILNGK